MDEEWRVKEGKEERAGWEMKGWRWIEMEEQWC